MDMKKSDLFPENYPEDLYDRIVKDGAGENIFNVYRVSELGINNRDAFLCTYYTRLKSSELNNRDAWIYQKHIDNDYDIGFFSTSCFDEQNAAKKILKIIEKRADGPRMLYGMITPEYGLSMKTSDSKSGRKSRKHHIDWWIYKDKDPSIKFCEMEVE